MSKREKILVAIIVALLIGLVVAIWVGINDKNKLNEANQNIEALTDTIHYYMMEDDVQLATIQSYVLERDELTKYIDVQKSEIKELEKKVGKLTYIANIAGDIRYDTIRFIDTLYSTPTGLMCRIHYKDDWVEMGGQSELSDSVLTTTMDSVVVPCPLQVGLSDTYNIWVKSSNPYMRITSLEGAYIGKQKVCKKTYWNLGIQAGFGATYNILQKDPSQAFGVGPYIGVGLAFGWNF